MRIGTIRELWRYPVKSMGGERVDATMIGALAGRFGGAGGVHGDRLWAVRDEARGTITTAKRIPGLLMLRARFVDEPAADVGPGSVPHVEITFPDGSTVRSDGDVNRRLSEFLGKDVTLHALRPASDKAHYKAGKSSAAEMREVFAIDEGEPLPDFSMMPVGKLLELDKYATPPGTYFDAMQLHVVTTASLGDFDARRFRANVVVDTGDARGYLENAWTGATLVIGAAAAFVDCPTPRCSMPTRAQSSSPGEVAIPADKTVLKTIARDADRCLGAYATVTQPGAARVGDEVTLTQPETSKLGDWARARATGLKRMLIRAAMPK